MDDGVEILRAPAPHTLEDLAERVRPHLERAGAERAIAFGSYARGESDAWSDLDLVVVLPTTLPFTERGRSLLDLVHALPVGVDLLVYTPDEYQRLLASGIGIAVPLVREGRVIYAR